MAERLKPVDVVTVVGVGMTGSILAWELAATGLWANNGKMPMSWIARVGLLIVAMCIGGPVLGDAESELRQFQARVKEFAGALQVTPQLETYSQIQRESVVDFVIANSLFVLLHESGHSLFDEFQVPVLGREEDAADQFAVISLLKVGSSMSHRVLAEAAKGWFLSDRRAKNEGNKPLYYDEHGLDQQRAYQIVCLMVGSNPIEFADLAKDAKLPEDRQKTCRRDWDKASTSWDVVVKPHRRSTDQPKVSIDVTYGDGKGTFNLYAKGFQSIRLLESVADYLSNELAWPMPFTLETQSCGFINARWMLATRKLTYCYELASDFADLYRVQGIKLRTTFETANTDDQPGYVPSAEAERIAANYQRQAVFYRTAEAPGTIIVSPAEHYLYVVQGKNRALRYGISVGQDCLQWAGELKVSQKTEWPEWTPTAALIARKPELPHFMAGGPGNPLGARALYLGNKVCQITGTNQPQTIGRSVNSGCFHLANNEVIDLYNRVPVGTRVVIRQAPEI